MSGARPDDAQPLTLKNCGEWLRLLLGFAGKQSKPVQTRPDAFVPLPDGSVIPVVMSKRGEG